MRHRVAIAIDTIVDVHYYYWQNLMPYDCRKEGVRMLRDMADVIIIATENPNRLSEALHWIFENLYLNPYNLIYAPDRSYIRADILISSNTRCLEDFKSGSNYKFGILFSETKQSGNFYQAYNWGDAVLAAMKAIELLAEYESLPVSCVSEKLWLEKIEKGDTNLQEENNR
jgi:5'(3')-deoxyribonucleotidase